MQEDFVKPTNLALPKKTWNAVISDSVDSVDQKLEDEKGAVIERIVWKEDF